MPSLPATPFGNEAGDLELPWYRPISFCEGVAQFLALRGILQQSFANLGVGGDVGIDQRGPLRRQPAIQAGLQVYLADGAGNVRHRARLGSLIRGFCPPLIYWRSRSRPRESAFKGVLHEIISANTVAAQQRKRKAAQSRNVSLDKRGLVWHCISQRRAAAEQPQQCSQRSSAAAKTRVRQTS